MKKQIILLCGPANVGKTTYTKEIIDENSYLISAEKALLSACKAIDVKPEDHINDRTSQNTKEEVLNLQDYILNEMICRAQDALSENGSEVKVIIDFRNLKPSNRSKVLKHFKGFETEITAVNFKCMGLTTTIEKLNRTRTDGLSTPHRELTKMISSFVPAITEEGFDKVIEIDMISQS